ncbi:MAG: hypothetical protein ACYS9X_15210, partial [Planctomycetota bacterium]
MRVISSALGCVKNSSGPLRNPPFAFAHGHCAQFGFTVVLYCPWCWRTNWKRTPLASAERTTRSHVRATSRSRWPSGRGFPKLFQSSARRAKTAIQWRDQS